MPTQNGRFIGIGCNDPVLLSPDTYYLEKLPLQRYSAVDHSITLQNGLSNGLVPTFMTTFVFGPTR